MTQRSNIGRARRLRVEQTEAEGRLWSRLRNRQLYGFKFRRQFPIDRYIADFVCIDAKLIVELDGGQHAERVEYDAERTMALEAAGFIVLRFWNPEVIEGVDGVLEAIGSCLRAGSIPAPSPVALSRADLSPPGRGDRGGAKTLPARFSPNTEETP